MEIKPIKTKSDYERALEEIESLFGSEPGTPEGERLEVLIVLVSAYEEEHYPIPLPNPIEAIQYHMERLGLTSQDLEPYIGTRSRVWEILNRKRRLTLRMIRGLSEGLDIPVEVLVQEYEIERECEEADETDFCFPELNLVRATNPEAGEAVDKFVQTWLSWIKGVAGGVSVHQVRVGPDIDAVTEERSVEKKAEGSGSHSETGSRDFTWQGPVPTAA